MLGHYDGFVSVQQLLDAGDFGLGACDKLDGELIVLDGVAYQAKADGSVERLPSDAKAPFAIMTPFIKSGEMPVLRCGKIEELETRLDGQLDNLDLFWAIRVDAEFDSITFRSVPKQSPPYRPLVEVAKEQVLHDHGKTAGTLIGIRTPKWAETLGVPGYHWHFLSRDRKLGGHVLNCEIAGGTLEFDKCDSWLIRLPDTLGKEGKDVSADLRQDVDSVEHVRQGKNARP